MMELSDITIISAKGEKIKCQVKGINFKPDGTWSFKIYRKRDDKFLLEVINDGK